MRRFWIFGLALSLAACDPSGHDLVVDLRTDLRAAYDFTLVRVTVSDAPDPILVGERRTQAAALGDDFVTGQRVAELRGVPVGTFELTLELLDSSAAVVALRRVRVELARSRTVTVVITSDCFAVSCPGGGDPPEATECVSGRCVSPGCSDENPDLCGGPSCTADAQCAASGVACVSSRCVGGECFQSANDSLCSPGEYCDVGDGCLPVPVFPDAGPVGLDAGWPRVDAGPACTPASCDDGDPCTDDVCGSLGCTHSPRCGASEYCDAGDCWPLPSFTIETNDGLRCGDVGVDHTTTPLWRRVVTGRPGATARQYNQHASCGESFGLGQTFVLDSSGRYEDQGTSAADLDCDSAFPGRYRAYVEVDGRTTPTVEVTYFNSTCSALSTCTAARSYCPPCRDCDPSTEYCYASSSCAPNPRFTFETSDGASSGSLCADVGRDHTGDFLWRRTVTGRAGSTAQQYNEKVSCGTAPVAAATIPLPSGSDTATDSPPGSLDCLSTFYGRYRAWVEIDGERSNVADVVYYNSNCFGALGTCSGARTLCPL